MTLSYLESLKGALVADTNISGMVDGKIYKFKALEKSEPDLRAAAHKSLKKRLAAWRSESRLRPSKYHQAGQGRQDSSASGSLREANFQRRLSGDESGEVSVATRP